jgi:hypothetical protein
MPSLGLGLSLGRGSFQGSSGGGYTPNYPSYDTTGSIPGLVGWYDSSQASSIVKDGSNNVSQWKNLFLGATQGGTHLSDFTIPSGQSAPTYSASGNAYVSGGATHSGIVFNGSSSMMSLASSLPTATQNFTIFFVFKAGGSGNLIGLGDAQSNIYFTPTVNTGSSPQYSYNLYDDAGSSVLTTSTGASYICGYVEVLNNQYRIGNYYYLSGAYSGFAASVASNSTVSSASLGTSAWTYNANVGGFDSPWTYLTLGNDALTLTGLQPSPNYSNGIIGEIIVYNSGCGDGTGSGLKTPSQFFPNRATILNYLYNKWK